MTEWTKPAPAFCSGGDCVEVALTPDGARLRDSKNPQQPPLEFTHTEWAAFVAAVTAGQFTPAPACPAGLLTQRERHVLGLAAEGHSNQKIATRFGTSLDTVKTQISHIFAKLEAPNRAGAVHRAWQLGILRRAEQGRTS